MSRVTGLPEINIIVDGEDFPLERLRQLDEVRVRQRLSLPALCELTFAHRDDLPGDILHGQGLLPHPFSPAHRHGKDVGFRWACP